MDVSKAGQATQLNSLAGEKKDTPSQSFGEVWKNIQTKMGAKPRAPRQIKKSLDKNDFMRIMIEQMKHQDPTKPFESDKLAAEIAQITSVEQLTNVNHALNKMASQNKPLERLSMTNLIGKSVLIDANRFPHKKGVSESLPFSLGADASEVKVSLISQETGKLVYEESLGARSAGQNNFNWNGYNQNNLEAGDGTYLLRVSAINDRGGAVRSESKLRSKVIGVSFEGSTPVFLVGDSNRQTKVTMDNIIQIEDLETSKGMADPAKPQLPTALLEKVQKDIAAAKSAPRRPVPPPAPKVSAPQQNQGQVTKAQPELKPSERGFPSGLSGNRS